uniref:Fibrinogen C-terminal domain-containing protein n=1 Tax=Cyprinus carpio TaxID=7962 RepID=A0A8C2HJJ3_CYPCA
VQMMVFLAALLPVLLGCDCGHDVDKPVDCSDVYKSGENVSGIYPIYPAGDVPVWVYCQMISDGKDEDKGGWTVIQRRMDGSVNFYRPWNQYRRGFGNVEREYWLGKISQRVAGERKGFALYSSFSVDCECAGYQLHVSGFTDGGAGDSLSGHNGYKFSTFDKDQDASDINCAKQYLGAFWYSACHNTNPNGVYLWGEDPTYYAIGVAWSTWKNYAVSMKFISMKIKRVS